MSDWRSQAACLGKDTTLFFPKSMQDENAWKARRICAGCPVAEACLRDALVTGDPHGIRGGMSPRQRTNIKAGKTPKRPRRPSTGGASRTNTVKSHCKNGHEFTPSNTLRYRGKRICLACREDRLEQRRTDRAAARQQRAEAKAAA